MTASGTRRGLDGKSYSAAPLTSDQRDRAINATHFLICGQGLSIRAAQALMAERYGIRRSRGAIAADLARFECDACAVPSGHPDT
jgi:hypothetical protein